MHPELEHRPRQGTARSDRNRALSEHRVSHALQRAISHGPVLIAHTAGMVDVRLETGYVGYVLDDGATGAAWPTRAATYARVEMRVL
jgi:hypothetical protein